MNGLYSRKEEGTTVNGNRYVILQDTPVSFHISISKGNNVIYEHFENPPSREFLDEGIHRLEGELLTMETQHET